MANAGSCRAAWMLFAIACTLMPTSPPLTKLIVSVAFAGIVRNRYVGDAFFPILNS